ETLDILAESGIMFTVLAPHQAAKVRKIGAGRWKDVSGGHIDPSRAYLCRLPSGRSLHIFFYDGPIARAVAFEGLLNKGEDVVSRLLTGFSDLRQWSQMLNIATDGESYGHHHRFGDMALAYALHHIETSGVARLTNYGEYLEKNPPRHEVQIHENTSWSCAHGIERWRSNCGCNSGGHPAWNQEWRTPLREALDWLRDRLSSLYEEKAAEHLKDPWAARDNYVNILADRSPESVDGFFRDHALKDPGGADRTRILELLEIQRHAMLMYTSCGWFFDDLSGLETVQILRYAGRAIQLSEKLSGIDHETPFREVLSAATSNLPEHGDGSRVFEKFVKPSVVDLRKVAAHYAISSLVTDYGDTSEIYRYSVKKDDYLRVQAGEAKLAVGQLTVTSHSTLDSETISFSALHLGDHIFNGGLKTFPGDEAYQLMKQGMITAFEKGGIADIIRLMDKHFGMNNYSLMDLFRDEQRKVLNPVIARTMEEFDHAYRLLYEHNRGLMTFLREAGIPTPKAFLTAAMFTAVIDLKRFFSQERIDEEKIRGIIDDIGRWGLSVDGEGLEFILRRRGEEMMDALDSAPADPVRLSDVLALVVLLKSLPVQINFWQIQNSYFSMARGVYKEFTEGAKAGDAAALQWQETFRNLGELLSFNTSTILGGESHE
ncbi:MAG TPA: DUF3536 domain-containing protein, partial [Thermodesulfovibrionales bacterium]|nr:DUF3536 domain-containing protein [Thermodesulfovibrionales bacterium]